MVINHKRVQRLMQELDVKASIRQVRRNRYSSYQDTMGKDTIKDNILKRDFKADKPNQKWVTDITEFKVQDRANDSSVIQRKLYLSPIIDLFNGEIVSYAIKDRPTYALVKEMLNDALLKLGNADRYDKSSKNGKNSKNLFTIKKYAAINQTTNQIIHHEKSPSK